MKKTKTGQKKHDNGVLKSVEYYKSIGYKVFADLPNYEKPKKISGFIPDVIARKGRKEVIIEVETKKTLVSDQDQQEAFKKYANKSSNRKFRKKIV